MFNRQSKEEIQEDIRSGRYVEREDTKAMANIVRTSVNANGGSTTKR